jgi:hypothetical protein
MENCDADLPTVLRSTNSSIKTQRDHGKRPSGHDFHQAISLRKMRLPLLPLVINSKAQSVEDDVGDGTDVLILVAPLECRCPRDGPFDTENECVVTRVGG